MVVSSLVVLSLVAPASTPAPAPAPGLTVTREVVASKQLGKPLEAGGHGPFVCRGEQRAAATVTRLDKGGMKVLTLRCPRPAAGGKASGQTQVLTLSLDTGRLDAAGRAAFDACAERFDIFKNGTGAGVFAAEARGRMVQCETAADDLGLQKFAERQMPALAARQALVQVDKPTIKKIPKLTPAAPTLTAKLVVPGTLPRAADQTSRVYASREVAMTLVLGFSPISPPPHAGGLGGPMQPIQGYLVQVADRTTPLPNGDPCAGYASPPGLMGISDGVVVDTDPLLAGARVALRAELPPQGVATGPMWVRVVPFRHAQSKPFDLQPVGERRCVVTPTEWVKVEVLPAPQGVKPAKPVYPIAEIFDIKLSYHPPRLATPVGMQIDYIGGAGMNLNFLSEYGFAVGEGCAYNPVIAANRINDSRDFIEEAGELFTQIWTSTAEWYNGIQSAIAGEIAGALCGGDGTCEDIVGGALRASMAVGAGVLGIPPELPDMRAIIDGGVDYLAAYVAGQVTPPGLTQAAVQAGVYSGLRASIDAWSCPALTAAGICDHRKDNPYTWGRPDPFWVKHPGMVYVSIRPRGMKEVYEKILKDEPERVPRLGAISVVETTGVFAIDHQLAPVPDVVPVGGIVIPFVLRASDGATVNDMSDAWATKKFGYKGHDEWGNAEKNIHRYPTNVSLDFVVVAGVLKVVAGGKPRSGESYGPMPRPRPQRLTCHGLGL